MARIRTIKPAFFSDWDLYTLEATTRLPVRVAFAGLWTVADKAGRFDWKPRELKVQCLPHDPVEFSDVLEALATAGFIRHYQVNGRCYGAVRSWTKHQAPNQREAESTLPEPTDTDTSTCTHVKVRAEGKGKEGKGTEGNGDSSESLTRSEPAAPAAEAMTLRQEPTTQAALMLRARADDGPVLFTFPTQGQPQEWRLRRVQVDEWQVLFPSLDIMAECRHAYAWVQASPGRRKTARGMARFLIGWFGRTVDRRGGNGHDSAADPGAKAKITAALERASAEFLES